MKRVVRFIYVLIGCLLIALSFNLFLLPNKLVSFGALGISGLMYYITGFNAALNLLIINIICLLIASLFLKKQVIKAYLLPSILVPLCIFLTSFISNRYTLEIPELMVVLLVAGTLNGYGYSMIYKQGYSAGVSLLIEEVIGHVTRFHSKMYSWIIDVILVVMVAIIYGYQVSLYSLVVIFISKYLVTKARFGINDSKMFYVITSKEEEVKHFIIHDLKCELSVLDVKGGFSKKKNRILLTVVPTSDYYKIKEGIKLIDEHAFIAITDTYDVVNRKSF